MIIENKKTLKVKRSLPLKIKPEDIYLFKNLLDTNVEIEPIYKLKNVFTWYRSIINLRTGIIYWKFTHYGWNFRFYFLKVFTKAFINWIKGENVEIKKAIWITDSRFGNYYHWLIDCLSRYYYAEKFLDGHKVIIPKAFIEWKVIKESLQMLKIPFEFYDSYDVIKLKEVIIPGFTGKEGFHHPELVKKIAGEFLRTGKKEKVERKIFISRKKAKYRFILNEDELLPLLEKHGFEVWVMEDIPFRNQVEIMQSCSHLIGLHGAGLTNMLFMPPGGNLLEIRNENDNWFNHFFQLCDTLGHNYYYLLAKGTSENTHQANFLVNLPNFEKALQELK